MNDMNALSTSLSNTYNLIIKSLNDNVPKR
jgi:hypothetical protein